MVTRVTQHKSNFREFLCSRQVPGRDLSDATAPVIPLATVRQPWHLAAAQDKLTSAMTSAVSGRVYPEG